MIQFKQAQASQSAQVKWTWPIQVGRYDRREWLTSSEYQELKRISERRQAGKHKWLKQTHKTLSRLLQPIHDVFEVIQASAQGRFNATRVILQETFTRQLPLWAWKREDWIEILQSNAVVFARFYKVSQETRQCVLALSYLLTDLQFIRPAGSRYDAVGFAGKVFGKPIVGGAIQEVSAVISEIGYGDYRTYNHLPKALCEVLLLNRSPYLTDLTFETLEKARQEELPPYLKTALVTLSTALVGLKILNETLSPHIKKNLSNLQNATEGVNPEWLAWCVKWQKTSTLAPGTRKNHFYILLKVGRWLTQTFPQITTPNQWTREIAVELVATVDRMKIGEWINAGKHLSPQIGKPMAAKTKDQILATFRCFFKDCQEWEWISVRFNPQRCFATPRSTRALIAPNPRIIQDDIWAKLLWAGLNLSSADLPKNSMSGELWYPFEMVRALTIVWLFSGLRSDEIARLRIGCIRWQNTIHEPSAVCLLEVPTNKTGTAFTKPVDKMVGEAIDGWEKMRPPQPLEVDLKTGEQVSFLFTYRGKQLGKTYLNDSLIPCLCEKAGVPQVDVRGTITSHRARSTIATQLFNAKEPMSLFELQAWLGHRDPSSTQHYAKITPTKLVQSYAKAGYFERNLRTIEVLIDQEAVRTGNVAQGDAWKFYDLGHGYCSYDFFDQCPHRMACAKCSFYVPKESSAAQLLEAKSNLLRMRQDIPLSDDEIAAVEDGLRAIENLCVKLADVPTPDVPPQRLIQLGRTPQK